MKRSPRKSQGVRFTESCLCRARLASLKVAVPSDIISTKEGKLWQETGMIGLLCSLFLLKQGAGEAAEAIGNKRALEVICSHP